MTAKILKPSKWWNQRVVLRGVRSSSVHEEKYKPASWQNIVMLAEAVLKVQLEFNRHRAAVILTCEITIQDTKPKTSFCFFFFNSRGFLRQDHVREAWHANTVTLTYRHIIHFQINYPSGWISMYQTRRWCCKTKQISHGKLRLLTCSFSGKG